MALHIQEPIPDALPQDDLTDPANRFSVIHLNSTNASAAAAADACGHHLPCIECGCQGFNPMKRRSPESDLESSRSKKHSCEQEDQTQRGGYSAVPLPLNLENLPAVQKTRSAFPVFRRCFSDPYTVPTAACSETLPSQNPSPEDNPLASRLPPKPPSLKRCVSDPSPSPAKTTCQDSCLEDTGMGGDLSKEENPSLMRMKRMKDRLREMKKWWDEVMQEGEGEQVDEGDKAVSVSQDDSGIEDGPEEIVSVEWVEKSLCINFKCPCGKGYQILLSGNKCYYKLV